eukprot:XP_022279557.1 uncharacterized protein LOC102151918 isoform X9 [Canis lupus familiaris]
MTIVTPIIQRKKLRLRDILPRWCGEGKSPRQDCSEKAPGEQGTQPGCLLLRSNTGRDRIHHFLILSGSYLRLTQDDDLTDLTERVLRDWTLPRGRNQSIYFTSEVGKQMGQNETKPAKGREAALQKSAVLAAATRRREAGEPASGRPGPSGGGKRRGSEASTTQERDAWRTGGAHTATVPSAQDRHAWPGGTQAEAQEDPRISQASWVCSDHPM